MQITFLQKYIIIRDCVCPSLGWWYKDFKPIITKITFYSLPIITKITFYSWPIITKITFYSLNDWLGSHSWPLCWDSKTCIIILTVNCNGRTQSERLLPLLCNLPMVLQAITGRITEKYCPVASEASGGSIGGMRDWCQAKLAAGEMSG